MIRIFLNFLIFLTVSIYGNDTLYGASCKQPTLELDLIYGDSRHSRRDRRYHRTLYPLHRKERWSNRNTQSICRDHRRCILYRRVFLSLLYGCHADHFKSLLAWTLGYYSSLILSPWCSSSRRYCPDRSGFSRKKWKASRQTSCDLRRHIPRRGSYRHDLRYALTKCPRVSYSNSPEWTYHEHGYVVLSQMF